MLTTKQAAARLGISLSLLYALAAEGRIRHVRIGRNGRRGKLLFAEADLERFVEECSVGRASEPAPPRPKPVRLQHLRLKPS